LTLVDIKLVAQSRDAVVIEEKISNLLAVESLPQLPIDLVVASEGLPYIFSKEATIGDSGKPESFFQRQERY